MTTKEILKIVAQVLVAALTALLTCLGMTSCGVTTAKIYNPQNGTNTSITIKTNNPTTVDVSPNVDATANVNTKK